MEHGNPELSPCESYSRILKILEGQLVELDRAGANKAGAHLDASIQQLRRDQRVLRKASAARGAAPSPAVKVAVLAPFSPVFSEALPASQVFALKAKPANSR